MNNETVAQKNTAQAEKKYEQRRRLLLCAAVAMLALFVVSMVFLVKGFLPGENPADALQGKWRYGENTIYEFRADATGYMCLQEESYYHFAYKVKDDTLKLDFEQTHITDCEYTFVIEGDTLTLTGGKGTVAQGVVYMLTRES